MCVLGSAGRTVQYTVQYSTVQYCTVQYSTAATIVVFIIHILTEALTQLHNLLTQILMGLLMRMLTLSDSEEQWYFNEKFNETFRMTRNGSSILTFYVKPFILQFSRFLSGKASRFFCSFFFYKEIHCNFEILLVVILHINDIILSRTKTMEYNMGLHRRDQT